MPSPSQAAPKRGRSQSLIPFALLSLLALAAFGVGVLALVDGFVQKRADHDARHDANSFVRIAVQPQVSERELRTRLDPSSRRRLDEIVRRARDTGEFTHVKIWGNRHRIVYSTDRAEEGRVLQGFPELDEALAGRETTKRGFDRHDDRSDGAPYQTYVPLRFGPGSGTAGVVEVHIPEDQLAQGLRAGQDDLPFAIAGFLVLLYLALLSIRAAGIRASRRHILQSGRLAAIVDGSDDVIIGKDLRGNVTSWNPGAERTYGYSAEEMVGKPLSALVPPDRPDDVPNILERIERGERVEQYETKRVTKDGRLIDVSISVSPIRGTSSAIVGAAVIAHDITDRKRADAELSKSQEQLAAAQRLAKLGSWTWDLRSNEVTWSHEMFRIWGVDESANQPSYDLFLGTVHPDDRPEVEQQVAAALADRAGYMTEFRLVTPDGTRRVVSASAQVIMDDDGTPARMVGSVLDVTDQKEIEAALRRSADDHAARAIEDPLTGLLNHGGFHEAVDRELARCLRYGGRFSLVLLDLDGFKPINDTYGHAEGDRVLREVADRLAAACRPSDVAGRLGGDEFGLLLPETRGDDAASAGERVQRAVADIAAQVRISFGVGQWPEDGPEKESVLFRADMALYASKGATRDGSRLEAAAQLAQSVCATESADRADAAGSHESIRRILDAAREQLGMDVAYVSEFVGHEQVIRSLEGSGGPTGLDAGTRVPLEESYCQRVVDGTISGVIADARNDSRVNMLPATEEAGIGSYVGVPVRLSDGRLYGTLCCASRSPNPMLANRDAAFMSVLARLVGDRLEHMALEAAARRVEFEEEGVTALLRALDARDSYTHDHSETVVALSCAVGRELGLPERALAELEQAARLHDIGKLGIPDSILNKPEPLDEEDWAVMREHPRIGAEIVASIGALAHLAPVIRAEHERWDGGGYPDGLAGDAIPVASRIVLVCDAYDAMTSDRPYRKAMPAEDAFRELTLHAGSQFDPTVVEVVLRVLRRDHLDPEQLGSLLG